MKQYYQFMLQDVVTDPQGLQTNANIDEFEEDLHKMLEVGLGLTGVVFQVMVQLFSCDSMGVVFCGGC